MALIAGAVVLVVLGGGAGVYLLSEDLPWASATAPDLLEEPELLWTFDIREKSVDDTGADVGNVETGTVSQVDGDTVAVTPWLDAVPGAEEGTSDGDFVPRVYGVNADSGDVEWTSPPIDLAAGPSFLRCLDAVDDTLPCLVHPVTEGSPHHAVGLDAGSGGVRWSFELPVASWWWDIGYLAAGDDFIVLSHDMQDSDAFLARLSVSTGEAVWTSTVAGGGSMYVSDPYLSVGDSVVRAETGEVAFRADEVNTGFVLVDGAVVRFQLDGDGVVERLAQNGVPEWTRLGSYTSHWLYISAELGRVLLASEDETLLTAVDVDTGEDLWTTGIAGGEFYVAGTDAVAVLEGVGYLRGVDLGTGQQIWRRETGLSEEDDPLRYRTATGDRQLYTLDQHGVLSAFDLSTGETAWQTAFPETLSPDAAIPWVDNVGERFFLGYGSRLSALG